MHTTVCQRWLEKKTSYRPAGEVLDPSRYECVVLSHTDAKLFITRHHYSGSMPASRFQVGLMHKDRFKADRLVGVAVFSHPMQNAVLSRHLGVDAASGAELGRFNLLDSVPGNGESWFLARANRLLYENTSIRALVSYCDPVARVDEDGNILKPGHVGTIYQSSNARMVGRSAARTLILTRHGRVLSERMLVKVKNDECGAAYGYRQMIEAGAPARRPMEDSASYVRRALEEGPFRKIRHHGNFVYCFALGTPNEKRRLEGGFAPALPYPKTSGMAVAAMRFESASLTRQENLF